MAQRQIVALGGHELRDEAPRDPLGDFVLALTGAEDPKVCFLPTASADDAGYIVRFIEVFGGRARCSHLRCHPWPPAEMREFLLAQDVIYVGGGNTANMLAIWRVHGLDHVLREAWEKGVVLAGVSAGAICWFEAGVTDSFGPQLAGMRDGLGFLPGSACPHYDGETRRRPVYQSLIRDEDFPPGYAADDGVGLYFVGTELVEAVSSREHGRAYRVGADGEQAVPTRLLA